MRVRFIFLLFLIITSVSAQTVSIPVDTVSKSKVKAFSHLDLAITAGVPGVGFDLSTPLSKVFAIRAGFAIMPQFSTTMNFGVQVGTDESKSSSKFEKLSDILNQITGYSIENNIDMVGSPTYYHGKVLLDIFPFHNKHWRFTVGCYFGNSTFAKAVNATEDMSTLLAVGTYNHTYEKMFYGEPFVVIKGKHIYLEFLEERYDQIMEYGRMGMHIGDYAYDQPYVGPRGETTDEKGNPLVHKAGTPYIMEPDEKGMVTTTIKVSPVRPYIGFGYTGALTKRNPRFQVGFDCGVMFWGGTPKVLTHDGTDLINDLVNVRGKVGRYVDAISVFKVCPVFDFRISYRLF